MTETTRLQRARRTVGDALHLAALRGCAAAALLALAACSPAPSGSTASAAAPAQVDTARLLAADQQPGNWMSHGRTYDEQRFSPLDTINADNIGRLGLAWFFDFPTQRGIEATPIVVDGVMYVTSAWSMVFALDAKTGKLLWHHDPEVPREWGVNLCCDAVNRGVAVWKGTVYSGTLDGRLLALDARDGRVRWQVQTTPTDRPYSITGAPRVVKDLVIIGNGGAELGVRGYVSAYRADTGELAWRFYTVPGDPAQPFENAALQQAARSWDPSGEYWKVGGGGTVWDSMAYDPALDLLYIGVGNGSPWDRKRRSPAGGDNLFLSSIVALRAGTGEYVWHYQTTPGENWDYTATQHLVLADIELGGKARQVIMQAPKNGFFYVLDRATGEFLSAAPYTTVTWATGIDKTTGRPVEADIARYGDERPAALFPHALGGHNWHPMSYSPRTGLVYIPAQEIPLGYQGERDFKYRPKGWNTGVDFAHLGLPDDPAVRREVAATVKGHISAWDPVSQREVWRVQHPNVWNGGLLSTAGNLIFQGNAEAEFAAYRADNGERLWTAQAQTGIVAAPISYSIDGEQYIAVAAGWGGAYALVAGELGTRSAGAVNRSRVLVYKLDGKAALPKPVDTPLATPQPPPLTADTATISQGHALYMRNCMVCHGDRAISTNLVPDLRRMSADTHTKFDAIVRGGLYWQKGMVGFGDVLTQGETDAIHAYLTKRGHDVLGGRD